MGEASDDSPLRSSPRFAAEPEAKLPQAELLVTPEVRTLLGYTRRVLHLHDQHTLAVFSYSGNMKANWLFLIDGRDLSFERHNIPNNDRASHGAALGADGNIYIMPYMTGRAYRFDLKLKKFDEIPVSKDVPEGESTWDALGASNGCVYFGAYPNACFGEYNLTTGKWTLWKQVAPRTRYVRNLREDADGRIHFFANAPDEVWMTFDPRTRRLERSDPPVQSAVAQVRLPDPPKGDQYFSRLTEVGGRHFAVGFPSSRLWEVTADSKLVLRGDPDAPAEHWYLESVAGAVVGISHFGVVFRFDLRTTEFSRKQLPNRAPGGNGIMFIEAINPHCVIGGNYSQQNLFRVDPESGEIQYSKGMVVRRTGELMCAVGFKGKAYIGSYIKSILSVYDPSKPIKFGENPRELMELGDRYKQTKPSDAVTDGRLVYISSGSEYSHLGGALAVIDPESERIDVYHHLVKDQDLTTLAYDAKSKLLWGGTNRWGRLHSHPPTQPRALIYGFDPVRRQVPIKLAPWTGADETRVLGVSNNGVLVAASGREIALIDTTTREIFYQGESSIGVPGKLRRGGDGLDYCLAGGQLCRWDFTRNLLVPVSAAPACRFLTEPSPGTWLLASRESIYRLRLSPRSEAR